MTDKRVGFACKLSELDSKGKVQPIESCNAKATTISWLNRQTKVTAEAKLESIMLHNVASVHNLVSAVSKMPELKRMVRIGSDILPAYTHKDWRYFYQSSDHIQYLE